MRPQKMQKLGFAHKAVRAHNPRLVYAALHGYRDGGPYSGQPAYDDVIQGQSGIAALMSVAGEPRYAPTIIADKICALSISNAIAVALLARERTGRGQFVEIPMFEKWCRSCWPSICSATISCRRCRTARLYPRHRRLAPAV